MTLSKYNFKLYSEMVMLPQIPQNWEGSGTLMGQVFSENPTLFFWKWGSFLESKWGNSWLPQSPTYSHYFTSETSERERKLASKSSPANASYDVDEVPFVLHKIAFPSYALSLHDFEKNLFVSL